MRSMARASPSAMYTSTARYPFLHQGQNADADDRDAEEHLVDDVQEEAAASRNEDPEAQRPVSVRSREHEAFEDLERGAS